ncbi:hypothetical protein [Actinokineospora sp. NPDC004072]
MIHALLTIAGDTSLRYLLGFLGFILVFPIVGLADDGWENISRFELAMLWLFGPLSIVTTSIWGIQAFTLRRRAIAVYNRVIAHPAVSTLLAQGYRI